MAVTEEEYIEQIIDEFVDVVKEPGWEFCIEIEGAPVELDILAKDISYEPITINPEEKNFGSLQVSPPASQERVQLTVTLRDTKEKILYQFCKQWAGQIVHDDGTFGVPAEYVKKVTVYNSTNPDDDPDPDIWFMYLTNVGAISKDRSSREYMEFPITLNQFKTNGFQV